MWSVCPSPGQHLVGELVADGLLLLHGLRPLVDVHREVVGGGDGTPADILGETHLNLMKIIKSCSIRPGDDDEEGGHDDDDNEEEDAEDLSHLGLG